ncbi:MAG: PAS domain-containing protein [Bacteroidales bacterium]|nr:PAS domain-containing protein [Bacteroidales bacterium]
MNDNAQRESKKRLPVQQAGKLDEEKDKEHHLNIELLCETAMQFVEFSHDKDIYKYIGEKLREFAGEGSYIIINSIDSKKNILTTRSFIGGRKLLLKIVKIIGQDPVGMTYDSTDAALEYLTDGKLHLYEEGIYGIALRNIPTNICKAIEKLASIEKIFTIGLIKENKLFGTVAIFLQDGSKVLKNKDIIEMFIKQASLAVQRRQAEEALKESEENLKNLFNSIQDGISILSKDLTILQVNKLMKKWYAESLPLEGKKCYNVYQNKDNQCDPCPTLRCLKTGKTEKDIVPGLPGSPVEWIELFGYPLKDSKTDEIIGVVEFVRDITERKKVEEEFEKIRERLELAMDAGEHGFWDWDLDTNDVFLSPRWYTMLGYKSGELPMRLETWVDLMHPDDCKTIVPEIENYVKNAQHYEVEFRLKTKDNDWKWISGRGKSYEKDNDGIPHRAVGVHVDITEHKRAEEELAKHREHLEELVQERTNDLEEKNRKLEKFNKLFVDREFRIKELRNKVKELEGRKLNS